MSLVEANYYILCGVEFGNTSHKLQCPTSNSKELQLEQATHTEILL